MQNAVSGVEFKFRESFLPWTEKYRPLSLSDVASHESIVNVIRKFVSGNKLPHLLLHGPPGTGKTSTILALTHELYGAERPTMVLELNASDSRGIDVVRDDIQSFASTARPFSSAFKLVVMDECDSMTKEAQFALRRIMEKYTQHTRFCLVCNYASKIIPALQSRCTKFRFAPIEREAMLARLRCVIQSEGLQVSDECLAAIRQLGEGDMRRTLNILQSACLSSSDMTLETIYGALGLLSQDEVFNILQSLLHQPASFTLESLRILKLAKSFALVDLVKALSEALFRVHLEPSVRAQLLKGLADIEQAASFMSTEKMQTLSLISMFLHVRGDISTCSSS